MYFGPTSVSSGSYLDLQPSGAVEGVIHNITHDGGIEIYGYDGTNNVGPLTIPAAGIETNLQFHVANAKRYRVKNTETTSKYIFACGMTTK